MKITEMKFVAPCDGMLYSWLSSWDFHGGDLFDSHGSSIASLEIDEESGDWVVTNWDGAKTMPGKYVHPIIGIFHKSQIREQDALAQASLTLNTFIEHGWTGRRKRGTGPFKGEYS
jgi:hypothetical protein